MELGTVGSIASVIGLAAAVAIAVVQRGETLKARHKAQSERVRAASLEDHLARQRWQQLRSIGEQIDALEVEGSYKHEPMQAALHARLREQYGGLLAVITTSTPGFSSSTVRHWVTTGRLPRPWQVAEAVSHLGVPSPGGEPSEDDAWLSQLLASRTIVPEVRGIRPPSELTQYVAAFILVADSVRQDLKEVLGTYGSEVYCACILLDHLAQDCLEDLAVDTAGPHTYIAWGSDTGKSFRERFGHYKTQDYWIVLAASQEAQKKLEGFRDFFEPITLATSQMLIPTSSAVDMAGSRHPKLLKAAAEVFRARRP